MTAQSREFERETLGHLREDFEAKGYTFIVDPAPTQLPDFLSGYTPDALAIGPNSRDKIIIDVKKNSSPANKTPSHQMDRDAAARYGWRYLLVYAGQDASELVILATPHKSQLDEAIGEVRSLEKAGYIRPAFLEGWSLLEALARWTYADDGGGFSKPLSSMEIVEQLAMDGQLDAPEAKRLRTLSAIRNAVAHGDLDVKVSRDDLRYLLDRIESINGNVTS